MEELGHTQHLLEPKLDLVAIRINNVGERKARRKLALSQKLAACAFNLCDCTGYVFGLLQAKPEVGNAAGGTCFFGRTFKRQNIERTWSLDLNLVLVAEVLPNSERLGIELQRLLGIAYCKADMSKTVGFEHGVAPEVWWA